MLLVNLIKKDEKKRKLLCFTSGKLNPQWVVN